LKYLTIKTADSMTVEEIQNAIGETEARNAAAQAAADEAAEATEEAKVATAEEGKE
jgi:hypothetical protein